MRQAEPQRYGLAGRFRYRASSQGKEWFRHRGTGIGVISTVPTVIIDGRWVCDDLVLAKSINKFLKLACSSRGGLCQYRSLSTRKLRSDLYRLSEPYHGCFEE